MRPGIKLTFALALVAAASFVAPAGAQTVVAPCVAETVRSGAGSESFSLMVCGSSGVGYNVQRVGSGAVSWTITTNLATKVCTWPASGSLSCTGGITRVNATTGTSAAITITTASGVAIAHATWDAPL